jgi:hypothetical protein
LADRLVRTSGLTWQSLLIPKREPETIEAKIDFALHNGDGILDAWEEGFLRGIKGRQFLTEKQLSKLSCIAAKVRAGCRP